ncbi:MAG: cyclin family protein, partial [Sulfobacillus sp.]
WCLAPRFAPGSILQEGHRLILVDWIHTLKDLYTLPDQVFFLAVNLLDAYDQKKPVKLREYQMIGAIAFYIATKICGKYRTKNGLLVKLMINAEDMMFNAHNTFTLDQFEDGLKNFLSDIDYETFRVTELDYIVAHNAERPLDSETFARALNFAEASLFFIGCRGYSPEQLAMNAIEGTQVVREFAQRLVAQKNLETRLIGTLRKLNL